MYLADIDIVHYQRISQRIYAQWLNLAMYMGAVTSRNLTFAIESTRHLL